MLLFLNASRIYNTASILIRNRKKKLCICSLSFLVHPSRSPGMMLLCLSACRIYSTFRIPIRSRKKNLGSYSIFFLGHPDRSPGIMLLCLSASRIYNALSILIRSRKNKIRLLFYILSGSPRQKSWHNVIIPERFYDIPHVNHFDPQPKKKTSGCCSISFLVHPGRSNGMMLLCLSASRIYNTFSILIRSRKKKLCSCFISFLVHPGRSPRMMLLCLSACRIYNMFSISIRSQKKKIRQLSYILSGSATQKSWHDVITPERFQDI